MANAASAGRTRQVQTLRESGTVAALDDTELLGWFELEKAHQPDAPARAHTRGH
jgi:hypothetical protein